MNKAALATALVIIGGMSIFALQYYWATNSHVLEQASVEGKQEEESMGTSTESFVATSTDAQIATVPVQPKFKAVLRAPALSSAQFARVADVFISYTNMTAGEDSRTGEIIDDGGSAEVKVFPGGVEIELEVFPQYDRSIEVSVLGLLSGKYDLIVFMTDKSGTTREYVYASSTALKTMDTYTFNIEAVSDVGIDRFVYGEKEDEWPRLTSDAGVCNKEALTKQLTEKLVQNGWDMEAVLLVEKKVGLLDSFDPAPLPFGKETVCAVQMKFKEEYVGEPFSIKRRNLVWWQDSSVEPVKVGGEEFTQSPADGPLGSANNIPFATNDGGVQFLHLSEHTELIGVNFPFFSTCPCAYQYEALLTAPLYP